MVDAHGYAFVAMGAMIKDEGPWRAGKEQRSKCRERSRAGSKSSLPSFPPHASVEGGAPTWTGRIRKGKEGLGSTFIA
ncbi:MAG: hypothetical protein DRJ97_07000 [Thermoprotei archaeon]|nr:MAG: hypothetical protein DRJ97_07000 [Thermoprotei archaeon]